MHLSITVALAVVSAVQAGYVKPYKTSCCEDSEITTFDDYFALAIKPLCEDKLYIAFEIDDGQLEHNCDTVCCDVAYATPYYDDYYDDDYDDDYDYDCDDDCYSTCYDDCDDDCYSTCYDDCDDDCYSTCYDDCGDDYYPDPVYEDCDYDCDDDCHTTCYDDCYSTCYDDCDDYYGDDYYGDDYYGDDYYGDDCCDYDCCDDDCCDDDCDEHKKYYSGYKKKRGDYYSKKKSSYDYLCYDYCSADISCYDTFTLCDGVITDEEKRIGEIVANHQFQFDFPTQPDALFTCGWSIVYKDGYYLLALNKCTTFWECAVDDCGTYKIYDKCIGGQCREVEIVVIYDKCY
ncbi:uncharacterized protein LODBEIA_P15890 [Lodderomyces beijingensis]|uniref:Cell wall mannoprotein PIR1-like C-terminal domain-containing protein n=1 Tax=Lodderomyces beijingensis TaxID=1775926 RepID=A0ABP0ZM68_9ASCO